MKAKFIRFFLVTLGCILLYSMQLTAQTAKPEVILKFKRQDNGKIAMINAVGQKVFNFEVSGLATQTDVSNFKSKFEGRQGLVSLTISNAESATDRSGTFIFERGTKGSYLRDLLIKAGIKTIYIDGVAYSVDELGKDN